MALNLSDVWKVARKRINSLNFYLYARQFVHCLDFIYARVQLTGVTVGIHLKREIKIAFVENFSMAMVNQDRYPQVKANSISLTTADLDKPRVPNVKPQFEIGDIVWAQARGLPSWPGKVVDASEVGKGRPDDGKVTIYTSCRFPRETVSFVFPRVLMFPETSSRQLCRVTSSRQLCKPSTSSRVCITVSNSPNPSRVYIRLCKHGKRLLLLKQCTVRGNAKARYSIWPLCHRSVRFQTCARPQADVLFSSGPRHAQRAKGEINEN